METLTEVGEKHFLVEEKRQSEHKNKLNDKRLELLKELGNLRNQLHENPDECCSLGQDDNQPSEDELEKQNWKSIKFIYGGTLKEEAPDLSLIAYTQNSNFKADDNDKYEE